VRKSVSAGQARQTKIHYPYEKPLMPSGPVAGASDRQLMRVQSSARRSVRPWPTPMWDVPIPYLGHLTWCIYTTSVSHVR
jgi:hypothetical protein